MEADKRNPTIRVSPHTRIKLKTEAARKNKTMQDFVEWLVDQYIKQEQEKGDKRDAYEDV